jgi:biopolymer transport protein ExbD
MAFHRSIRERRIRKRIHGEMELQLTSLMDVLVIILVFLLKSYAATTHSFNPAPGIQLPTSASTDTLTDSLAVIVTPEGLTFENERILDFSMTGASAGTNEATYDFRASDLDENGRRIVPLYNALVRAREKAELITAKSGVKGPDGNPPPFEGILAVQADKRIQYDTIRKVMYTSAAAGYRVFRFLALRREQ